MDWRPALRIGAYHGSHAELRRPPVVSARRSLEISGGLLALVCGAVAGLVLARLGDADNQLKAIVVAFGAVAVALTAIRPATGLGLVVVMVPFEFPITVGGVITGTNEILLCAFAALLIWHVRLDAVPAWARFGTGAIVIGSFLSTLGAFDPTTAAWGGVRWLVVAVIVFAAFSVLRDREDAEGRALDLFTGAAVVVVGFAALQYVGIDAIVGPPYDGAHVDSSFGYYTNYAGFVGVAAVLATGEALHAWVIGRPGRATLYGFALVVLLLGAALSLSRGGVLVVGAGWLTLVALSLRRGSVAVRAVVLLTVLAVAAYVAVPSGTREALTKRVVTRVGSQTEDKTRFALQQTGRRAAFANPLGLGYGNFPDYLNRNAGNSYIGTAVYHSHQLPTQIAIDSGWLGLLGFVVLLGGPFIAFLRRGPTGPSDIRAATFLAAIAGFVAQGMFDYLLVELAMVAVLGFLVWGAGQALRVTPGGDARTPAS